MTQHLTQLFRSPHLADLLRSLLEGGEVAEDAATVWFEKVARPDAQLSERAGGVGRGGVPPVSDEDGRL